MSEQNHKYCEYFDVDKYYFPCVDESAINNEDGPKWYDTYPHEKFIELLDTTEKMLSGVTKRSIWIHGAYGTGKSRCAYTVQKLLQEKPEAVRNYWSRDKLKEYPDLLQKLIGHKERGVLAAYIYGSGGIDNPQKLFFAVQDSIKVALEKKYPNDKYGVKEALREGIIDWLNDLDHKVTINTLLKNKEKRWKDLFSQSTAEEIVNDLKGGSGKDVLTLVDNLLALGDAERIDPMMLSADSLKKWIIDIIDHYKISIVLFWDEFGDYFSKNSTSLSEFQRIVTICQEKPFYLVIITPPLTSLSSGKNAADRNSHWSKVRQRFTEVEITLPHNIAFELIKHAFSVKPAAQGSWDKLKENLIQYVPEASRAVMEATKIVDEKVDEKVVRDILPIHPIAALVLKHIASAFKFNQRSMFDFIKMPNDTGIKAFQWFIQNTGPFDDRRFLTVDMLWNFFYENGKDDLAPKIRNILDCFNPRSDLTNNEEVVLKTILIMQAVSKRLDDSLPILRPTKQNLEYAFEGQQELSSLYRTTAQGLVDKNILKVTSESGDKLYSAAFAEGNSAKLQEHMNNIRSDTDIDKLVSEGNEIGTVLELGLSPALALRYTGELHESNSRNSRKGKQECKLQTVTINSFTNEFLNKLKIGDASWRFYAVIALAKTSEEAKRFRSQIETIFKNSQHNNIVVIDALSTPLGEDDFENYVQNSAYALFYQNDEIETDDSRNYSGRAKDILNTKWKKRIQKGGLIVRTPKNDYQANDCTGVRLILQDIVQHRFKYVLDFKDRDLKEKFSESIFQSNQTKQSALLGIDPTCNSVKGASISKSNAVRIILEKFRNNNEYWQDESLEDECIVNIKKQIDKKINEELNNNGRISIGNIYDNLETNFGFSKCNFSAYITGFLLKEFSRSPYCFMDSNGVREPMTPAKLSEMIGQYISKKPEISSTYIVNLTKEEKSFLELTETAWGLTPNSFSSPQQATTLIRKKIIEELKYPLWCLEKVGTDEEFKLVQLFIELIQSKGEDAASVANQIGETANRNPEIKNKLKDLLTSQKCKEGMHTFLTEFDKGKLLKVAREIHVDKSNILEDIENLFAGEYAALWNKLTGESEIRKLKTDYKVVKFTNSILSVQKISKKGAIKEWRDNLKLIGFSCQSISEHKPELKRFFSFLLMIAKGEQMLPEHTKSFLREMIRRQKRIKEILSDTLSMFKTLYSEYLEGLSDEDCMTIRASIKEDMFVTPSIGSRQLVQDAVRIYKTNQIKFQLAGMWEEKTGTKNPLTWSKTFRTPILCCINQEQYSEAKKTFETLNSDNPSESDVSSALKFLRKADFFDSINSPEYRNQCFMKYIVRDYINLIPDIEEIRDELEKTNISPYEWKDHPSIETKLFKMAKNKYEHGGSKRVVDYINNTTNINDLRKWLTDCVESDVVLGIKLIRGIKPANNSNDEES